jgi:hypothetical protein
MSSTVPYKFTTANTTNLQPIKAGMTGALKGVQAVNTTAAAVFLKIYWFQPTTASTGPTVGTTVPNITILLPALGTTTGNFSQSWPDGITGSGQIWCAVTNLVADSDATAVAANSAVVTLFVE